MWSGLGSTRRAASRRSRRRAACRSWWRTCWRATSCARTWRACARRSLRLGRSRLARVLACACARACARACACACACARACVRASYCARMCACMVQPSVHGPPYPAWSSLACMAGPLRTLDHLVLRAARRGEAARPGAHLPRARRAALRQQRVRRAVHCVHEGDCRRLQARPARPLHPGIYAYSSSIYTLHPGIYAYYSSSIYTFHPGTHAHTHPRHAILALARPARRRTSPSAPTLAVL